MRGIPKRHHSAVAFTWNFGLCTIWNVLWLSCAKKKLECLLLFLHLLIYRSVRFRVARPCFTHPRTNDGVSTCGSFSTTMLNHNTLTTGGKKSLDGYNRKKYVSKLLFIFLLGNDLEFGHLEAVNLLSAAKFSEKQIVSLWFCKLPKKTLNIVIAFSILLPSLWTRLMVPLLLFVLHLCLAPAPPPPGSPRRPTSK